MYKRGMCKQVEHGCHVAAIPKKKKNNKKNIYIYLKSQSQLYCQFYHMYIQRIEIALLSYSLVHTDNTKH